MQLNSPSYNFTQTYLNYAMKKFIVPIVSILGLFLVVFVVLASTERTTTAALLGAGYSAFLMAIYALIPAIKNPSYSMWWSLPDDVTPAERWGFYKRIVLRDIYSLFCGSTGCCSNDCVFRPQDNCKTE